jgi:anthranilate synthase component I
MRPTLVIVFDAVKNTLTTVTPVCRDLEVPATVAFGRAAERLSRVVDHLDRPLDKEQGRDESGQFHVVLISNTTPDEFKTAIQYAEDYIAAGDVFQVVLSQRFKTPFSLSPFARYRTSLTCDKRSSFQTTNVSPSGVGSRYV